MKKVLHIVIKLTVVFAAAAMMLYSAGCLVTVPPTREELIEQAFVDAADINSNSCFGKCSNGRFDIAFLSRLEEGEWIAMGYFFEDNESYASYFPYADAAYCTEIIVKTDDYHVYGIRPGDSIEQAGTVLEQKGFEFDKEVPVWYSNDSTMIYRKGLIVISLYYDPDLDADTIDSILVKSSDPQYNGVIWN